MVTRQNTPPDIRPRRPLAEGFFLPQTLVMTSPARFGIARLNRNLISVLNHRAGVPEKRGGHDAASEGRTGRKCEKTRFN
jgi:hypothetical protein